MGGPPPHVAKQIRLAYWRLSRKSELEKLHSELVDLRKNAHEAILRTKRMAAPGSGAGELPPADPQQWEKLRLECNGLTDLYERLRIQLDGVDIRPDFDDVSGPDARVRMARKSIVRQIEAQLSFFDTWKSPIEAVCASAPQAPHAVTKTAFPETDATPEVK